MKLKHFLLLNVQWKPQIRPFFYEICWKMAQNAPFHIKSPVKNFHGGAKGGGIAPCPPKYATDYAVTFTMTQYPTPRPRPFAGNQALENIVRKVSSYLRAWGFPESSTLAFAQPAFFFSGRKAMADTCTKFWSFVGNNEGWSGAEFLANLTKRFWGGMRGNFSFDLSYIQY